METPASDLTEWKELISRIATRSKTCTIALVGKYVKLHDAYLSVMESLYHAGFENESKVRSTGWTAKTCWIRSAALKSFPVWMASSCPAALATAALRHDPGRPLCTGTEHPVFWHLLGYADYGYGICRDVLGYADANSSEFTPDGEHNVIALMPDQQGTIPKAATMRLGKVPLHLPPRHQAA